MGHPNNDYFLKCSQPFGFNGTRSPSLSSHICDAARREDFANLRHRYAGDFLRNAAIGGAVKSSS